MSIKVPGWICIHDNGEVDHDWEYHSDWYGDPGVINGTANIYFRRCAQCGFEEECGPDDMPVYED